MAERSAAIPRVSMPGGAALLVAALAALLLLVTFREGLAFMVAEWDREEYSYGILIPFIALYMLIQRADLLHAAPRIASWSGFVLVLVGIAMAYAGRVSIVYILIQYGFLLALVGILVAAGGWRMVRSIWVPLIYLLFMIPLPRFVYANLSAQLQLISSELGTDILRVMGVSVFLEGNVIDLGSYQLQVAEACNGLRYLFPLMSFGFLCAFLFKGRFWQRALVFVASIPVTVFMNSFRIAVTGYLVDKFGIAQAEGFLHWFEGWVIFVGCMIVLFLLMWLFAKLDGRKLDDVFDADFPGSDQLRSLLPAGAVRAPVVTCLMALVLATLGSVALERRVQLVPDNVTVSAFPLRLGEWSGQDRELDSVTLNELQLNQYFLGSFAKPAADAPVELYVAYYEAQNRGAVIHSPRGCLPAGGWEVASSEEYAVPGLLPDGNALRVNRVLIQKGEDRLLVYYWFDQRGRNLTNEYVVKWYLFQDAALMNRTDGSLVRVVTPVPDVAGIAAADARLQDFLSAALPRLAYHLPQKDTALRPETLAAAGG